MPIKWKEKYQTTSGGHFLVIILRSVKSVNNSGNYHNTESCPLRNNVGILPRNGTLGFKRADNYTLIAAKDRHSYKMQTGFN